MRFESLNIEKYGLISGRMLNFPASPGLVMIYGPNEAGKSTILEAISDFLFGIPNNTARGQVFGYDNIRLSSSFVLADGTHMTLKRRKGRGRTLTDSAGQAVDDDNLSRFLGTTGRERFSSLFGLSHITLRSGGEHLLAADGDVGRLILEAGGGLRSLVDIVDDLARQASVLFDTRRKSDRLFYIGLDAFQEADTAVKQGLMTREAYEQAGQRQKAAQSTVEDLRRRQQAITEETLRLSRLARVVPSLRDLDRVADTLTVFADLSPLRDDFARSCDDALRALATVEEALRESEGRCKGLQAKIDALVVPNIILAAESAIRDAGEKAVHVAKAREDRSNRDAELSALSDKLKLVRRAVGLSTDTELEVVAPSQEAISSVQKLAAVSIERRGKITGLIAELARESKTLDAIRDRQEKRRASGAHEPFGMDAADFANLTTLVASAEAKGRHAAQLKAEIDARLHRLGFTDIDELKAWSCPDSAVIQSEIVRRTAIETEQIRVLDRIATETEKRDSAAADIERLETAGEVPAAATINHARGERDRIWSEIRERYVSPDGRAVVDRSLSERIADVDLKQDRSRLADDLADRKSIEADRVAALDLAQRQQSSAVAALNALSQQQTALLEQLTAAEETWRAAWPDAVARADNFGRLKILSDERAATLAQLDTWKVQADDVDSQNAGIAPRLVRLSQAEARLGLPAGSSLATRLAALTKSIKSHDDTYADYRRDENALRDVQLKIQRIQESHDELTKADADWQATWVPAVRALRLDDSITVERANEIATQWATAIGLLDGVRLTRLRLKRMDDDEAALLLPIQAVADMLDFALPDDSVAAAKMLTDRLEAARKIQIERDSLTPQLMELVAERDQKTQLAHIARAKVAALCQEASCDLQALPQLVERCKEWITTRDQHASLIETTIKLGDGHSIGALREQWAGRDLDEINARLQQLQSEGTQLTEQIDAALAESQDRTRELSALTSSEGINTAVAQRERATAEIHRVLERYVEIALAEEVLRAAMDRVREQQKDPLIVRAGELFGMSTAHAFAGIEADIDDKGHPVVVGRRITGELVPVSIMSDGVRDQLFLSFRIASIEQYCRAAEPLPFIADDVLVHFDDDRGVAALKLLCELSKITQVLVFTHHRHVAEAVSAMAAEHPAAIVDLTAS